MSTSTIELVAVACVVESSLVLASEWSRVLVDYISPLLKRLGEAHTVGHQMMFRIAFVTYATADTRPTPLLAKRFFVPVQSITKELREEPGNLGIGHTGSESSRGMAALEGLVAAIELFDTLRASIETKPLQPQSLSQPQQQTPRLVCHILHIAASKADGAQRPLWNHSMRLDDVSWQTLPAELKKRNINLSVINLRPNHLFSELHSSSATKGVTPPWFKVKTPHALFLTGFPSEHKPTKRPADSQSSPESKRAKVSPAASESPPKQSRNLTNSIPVVVPSTQPAQVITPQPPTPNPPHQPQPPRTGPPTQQAILARLQGLESNIQKLSRDHSAAVEQGRSDEATQLKKDRDSMQEKLNRFKQAMKAMRENQLLQQARSNPQGPPQPPHLPAPGNTNALSLSQMPPTNVDPLDAPRGPDTQTFTQPTQIRSGSSSLPQITNPKASPGAANQGALPFPSDVKPELVGQMQETMDMSGKRPAQPPPLPVAQQNPLPAMLPQISSSSLQTCWEGSLTWAGFDANTRDRKELHAQVKVTCPNGDIFPRTWPGSLTLTPSQPIAMNDLQAWVKRAKPRLCTISSNAKSVDKQSNERHIRSLIELLMVKHMCALATWTIPSGSRPTNNLLIFPINATHSNGLVGAAFPTSGIPEMPKALFPPGIAGLSQEQRQLFAQWARQKQQERHQQQQSSIYDLGGLNLNLRDSGPFGNFKTNNNVQSINLFGGSSQGGSASMGGLIMPPMGLQPDSMGGGLHRRTPSGNPIPQADGMGNVSPEMLQSFMQRNVDGSGGAGTI